MWVGLSRQDRAAGLRVLAGICGNLSAGWLGVILIAPGFSLFARQENLLVLMRSLVFGIVFLLLAFMFERRTK